MSAGIDTALRGYAQAIARRTGYLILTGRLSHDSENEMQILAGQLEVLDEVLAKALTANRTGSAVRSIMIDACLREVRRRRQLVVEDGEKARQRARLLRERAALARREGVRSRLRVIDHKPTLELSNLERVAQRWAKAG